MLNSTLKRTNMNLSKTEITRFLSDDEHEAKLLSHADAVRSQYVGDEVHLRALLEFSNICRNNCLYCGLRRDNLKVKRYHLSAEEMIETARLASQLGFKTVVMQSGEDMYYTAARLCPIIEAIKKFDVAITLSIGERSYADYKAFREAGADRYLMRIETTNQELYHRLDPNMSWQHRYDCLMMIKELGYELGSGIMVGLPDQTIDSVADDLLFLQQIGVDMAGIGPFIPHPETPLADCKGGTLHLALRTMAIMRLLLPDINIPATTAMEVLAKEGQTLALNSGANVLMPNVTAGGYCKLYELYPGQKHSINNTPKQWYDSVCSKINSIGRIVGQGYGGHKSTLLSHKKSEA